MHGGGIIFAVQRRQDFFCPALFGHLCAENSAELKIFRFSRFGGVRCAGGEACAILVEIKPFEAAEERRGAKMSIFHKEEASQRDAAQRQSYFEKADQKRRTMEEAISQRDIPALRQLVFEEDEADGFLIALQYQHFLSMPFEKLNPVQRLFSLCMRFEDSCQADSILSLTEEKEDFLRLPQMYEAYMEMGATKTAQAVRRMIELMPERTFEDGVVPAWNWFFADPERERQIKEIDSEIAGYPDGVMRERYKSYLQRENVIETLIELSETSE